MRSSSKITSVMVAMVVLVAVAPYSSMASPTALGRAVEGDAYLPDQRDAKFINLQFLPFVTVKVQPTTCTSKSDNSSGTCTSRGECTSKGGRADGSCANGFAVCCVYEKRCGSIVVQNNTYLLNDAYPDTFMDIDNCQYTIEKINSGVCQVRLDFLNMRLQGPDNTSQCSHDTFTFVGTAGANPTVICGDNSGQHMYLDLAGGTGAARINIATTTNTFSRSWRIKVTQIPCISDSRAPPHCLQYYTQYSGTINSFNYQETAGVQQLAGQQYTTCIRTREGFCGIKYTADHFSLSGNATEPVAASGDANCQFDFVMIPVVGKDGTVALPDRFCGSKFVELTNIYVLHHPYNQDPPCFDETI
ncbi:uncharacterized protein [Panulirus ornatus]|uniref:uncharacterized protein isoform X2 n=1 Tax=Panulirus ornatus TaxID=150431 RepID=UPI003A8579BA